jgi:tripartite-type tricarboxylate transporter receptor subunit TctC
MKRRATLALLALPALARAQLTRPVRLVVPFPPGGSNDVISRPLAEKLASRLGQPVVVENRPGAGGSIGAGQVAQSVPDGTTLMVTSSSFAASAVVQRTPYDPERDFTPILGLGISPYILVVRSQFPAANAREFVDLLRANPGKYSFASSGVGGSQHLVTAVFNARAELDTLHVPFQGSTAAMAALMSGTVDYAIETPAGAWSLVRQGALRALGHSLPRLTNLLPGLPTLAEAAGLPGYGIGGWNGIMGPANIPAPIVERLVTELTAILAMPAVRERLEQIGLEPEPRGPDAFAALLREQRDVILPLIRRLGIRAE